MDLTRALEELVDHVPRAIGAIVCDFEGETVMTTLGAAPPPPEAEARAMDHVPRRLALTTPVAEFLMRLAGAEPCALLRMLDRHGSVCGGGKVRSLHLVYEAVELLVELLPNDYYLVLVLRRPALACEAWRHAKVAAETLGRCVT